MMIEFYKKSIRKYTSKMEEYKSQIENKIRK